VAVQNIFNSHTPKDDDCKDGFKERLHLKLAKADVKKQKSTGIIPYWIKPVLMPLFSLMVVVGVFVLYEHKVEDRPVLISKSNVDHGKPVTIKLKYTALENLNNVKIKINLEDALSFYSKSEKITALRDYTWLGNLKKGVNEIPFVVSMKEKGVSQIHARATFDGYDYYHKIVLDARGGNVLISYFEMYKKKAS